MKIRALSCLIGLMLLPGAAAGQDGAPPSTTVFNCLWRYKPFLDHEQFRLVVVEPTDPGKLAKLTGTGKLNVRILSDVKNPAEKPAPEEVALQVSVGGRRQLAPDLGKKYYLALLRHRFIGRDRLLSYPMMFYNLPPPGKRTTNLRQYYLLGVDSPDAALTRAIRELLLGKGPAGKPADKFARMMAYIGGPDKPARDFAISFAAVNGWGFSGSDDQRAQPDAFARMLLGMVDPEARRLVAAAYSAAKTDLLPRDPELLERIFHCQDEQILRPALQDNLGYGVKRLEALRPLIRQALARPGPGAKSRLLVLRALGKWDAEALAFRGELEAIARGEATPSPSRLERLAGLWILLDWKVDSDEELVRRTLVAVPSAVALSYAADQRHYALVPAIIQAVRQGRLVCSDAHLAALSQLTHRFPDGSFDQFDAWWAGVEKAGRTEEMLQAGFADAASLARARRLVARIGSSVYKQREAARAALAKLGLAALPALKEAAKHDDPEIAVSAELLIRSAQAKLRGCEIRLAKAASSERSGKALLPLPEEPTTQATQPAADSGPRPGNVDTDTGGNPIVPRPY